MTVDRLARDFYGIIDGGVNTMATALHGSPVEMIRGIRRKEADILRREIVARLGGGDESAQLVDRFECMVRARDNLDPDFFYAQGIQDGYRLAKILDDGKLVSWLAAVYPPTLDEEE